MNSAESSNSPSDILRKHYPFKSHFVSIAGHQMHYVDEGEGDVIIMLHGNPTWGFYYRKLIEQLKANYRVVVPDMLGMGLSDHPETAKFRSADRVNHLQEFIDTLKIEKFSLVMHDWGGSIGSALAVRNIDKVNRLVYFNTTLTVTECLPLIIKRAASPLIGRFLTQVTKRFLKLTTNVGVSQKLDKEIKKCYLLPYRTKARRKAIWDFVDDIPFENTHPSYQTMLDLANNIHLLQDKPVQIIWGLKDPCFHREMLNHVAALFPQAKVLEIPSASHLVLEDAEEKCVSTIKNFMAEDYTTAIKPGFTEENVVAADTNINPLYKNFLTMHDQQQYVFAAIEPNFLLDELQYKQINYKELRSLINKYQRGLLDLGLKVDDKVLMLVTPGINFLALSYAIMAQGAVPVFLDPGMGKEKLFKSIEELEPDIFIGSIKAQILRMLKPKLFKSVRFSISATEWFFGKAYSLSFLKKFADQNVAVKSNSQKTALIAYTSGGTGRPKGVVFDYQMIEEQLRIFREDFRLEAGKKDLPLLPIFSLYNLALGVTSVIAPINPSKPLDLDPRKIVQVINDLGIDYSFGSPTLWRKIGEYCSRSREELPSLSKIFMAGTAVPQRTIKLLKQFMKGEVYTPYGATEALPTTLVSGVDVLNHSVQLAEDRQEGTFVGKVVQGVEVKIVSPLPKELVKANDLEVKPPLEIGELLVSGKNVSKEYLNLPEVTAESKIKDENSIGGFWHTIGDMAYQDHEGNLYFCGRKAHMVETAERVYYSEPCELPFNRLEKVYRSALVALEDNQAGIVIEPHPGFLPETQEQRRAFIAELKAVVKENICLTGINRFFFRQDFPVDGRHNAKIFRDKLGEWASKQDQNLTDI